MGRTLLAVLLLLVILWLMFGSRLRRLSPRALLRWALVALGIGLLFFLAITGRLNWLYALIAALIPLVQRMLRLLPLLPMVQRLLAGWRQMRGAGGPATGQTSSVETRFLRMTLDHDSGALAGVVVAGQFAGKALSELQLPELLVLLEECRSDHQSVMVLETYLDRLHGDAWRDARASAGAPPAANGPMTREEAYRILGLQPGAEREEVIKAHRRLMQKLHPDRGGSDWLAAQINRAKALLLDGEA